MAPRRQSLEIPPWLFLALVGEMEHHPSLSSGYIRSRLLRGWRESCEDIEARLVDLARISPDACVSFQVDQSVHIDSLGKAELDWIAIGLRLVLRRLAALPQADNIDGDIEQAMDRATVRTLLRTVESGLADHRVAAAGSRIGSLHAGLEQALLRLWRVARPDAQASSSTRGT